MKSIHLNIFCGILFIEILRISFLISIISETAKLILAFYAIYDLLGIVAFYSEKRFRSKSKTIALSYKLLRLVNDHLMIDSVDTYQIKIIITSSDSENMF